MAEGRVQHVLCHALPRSKCPESRGGRVVAGTRTVALLCNDAPSCVAAYAHGRTTDDGVQSAAMTRRHVLAAIARGIEQGDEFAARALFAKGDPIGRRLARRR